MRIWQLCGAVLCLALMVPALALAQTGKTMMLEEHKWKNRLLLVFAPDQKDIGLREQMSLIEENVKGLQDRQLLVLELVSGGEHAKQRQELLKRFGVKEDAYTLILLGKDGQEKYRSAKPVRMEEIFSIIDQMPMRQQEMRKQE